MPEPEPDAAPDAAPQRSLSKSILRDGAIYAVAGLASQGIAFVLFPFFAHVFDPRDYGVIDLVGVMMTLVTLVVALEVAQGLGRSYADARTDAERRAYASTAFTFSLACYGAFCVAVALSAGPLTRLLLGADVDPVVMRLAAAVFFLNGMSYLALDLLRWQLRPVGFAISAVTLAAVVTGSSAIYVLVLDMGVEGALLGQVTGFVAGATVAYAQTHRSFRLHIDREKLREMLRFSLPLVPASAGVFLNGYADRVAIQARSTLTDVGIYGVAYRLSLIVSLVLIGFQGALLPQVLRNHEKPDTPGELARVFRLFSMLALCVLLLVSTWADEIIRVLTRPAYYGAEEVVPFVVAAAFFAGMYIFAPGLSIARRTKPLAVVTAIGGLANLVLAFSLVGVLGILGAALSFLAAEVFTFGMLMWLSQRMYHVPHPWRRLSAGLGVGAVLTAAGWLLPAVAEHGWALPVKAVLALGGVSLLGWMLTDADERAMGRDWLRILHARLRRRAPGASRGSAPATAPGPPGPPAP